MFIKHIYTYNYTLLFECFSPLAKHMIFFSVNEVVFNTHYFVLYKFFTFMFSHTENQQNDLKKQKHVQKISFRILECIYMFMFIIIKPVTVSRSLKNAVYVYTRPNINVKKLLVQYNVCCL